MKRIKKFGLPLNLCGLMLLMASTSKLMAIEFRWPVRAFGMLLLIPGIILMLLTLPLREEDSEEEDELEGLDLPHAEFCAERLAEEDSASSDEHVK